MKRSLYSPPDPFSLLPLLALLPAKGKVQRLDALRSSLFARYEKVAAMKRDNPGREQARRIAAEEGMLKQVLDWLAVTPESGGAQ